MYKEEIHFGKLL